MSQIRVDVLIHQLVGLLGKGTGGWRQTGALQSSGSDGLERLVRSGGQLDLDLIAGVDDAASREQLRRRLDLLLSYPNVSSRCEPPPIWISDTDQPPSCHRRVSQAIVTGYGSPSPNKDGPASARV